MDEIEALQRRIAAGTAAFADYTLAVTRGISKAEHSRLTRAVAVGKQAAEALVKLVPDPVEKDALREHYQLEPDDSDDESEGDGY